MSESLHPSTPTRSLAITLVHPSASVGFEPTRASSNGFQVQRLPRRVGGFPAAGLLCPRQVPAMRMVAVLGAPWCHKLYNVSYYVFGSDFPPCTDPPLLVACPVCVMSADLRTYSSRTGACSLARTSRRFPVVSDFSWRHEKFHGLPWTAMDKNANCLNFEHEIA